MYVRAERRGEGREDEEGGGEGGKKKCTAEGRVETDTGSKMAQSPPAPSPAPPHRVTCSPHSLRAAWELVSV